MCFATVCAQHYNKRCIIQPPVYSFSSDTSQESVAQASIWSSLPCFRGVSHSWPWESDKIKKPVNPTYFRKLYKAELDKIEGVRYLSPHSCRHTYVSQLQALGVDMETIKSIVGHADLDMTRHYLHVQEPVRKAAALKLNDAFSLETKDDWVFLYQRNQTANCRQNCRQDISAKTNEKWQVRKLTKNIPK